MSVPTDMRAAGPDRPPDRSKGAPDDRHKQGPVASTFDAHRSGFLAGGTLLGFIAGFLLRLFGAPGWLAVGTSFACIGGCLALAYIRPDPATLALSELQRRQRSRSIAIGLALGVLVALFYVATIVRLGGNVANRAL